MNRVESLTPGDQHRLAQRVLEIYSSDPGRFKKWLPELSDFLDEALSASPESSGNGSPFGLTRRERDFHEKALRDILRRVRSLSTEEAVKGLEHGAVLLDDRAAGFALGFPNREELLKLVRKATGIQPRKTGKPVEKVVCEGEASRSVPVVRGVDLHLTWEFKLVKVTMDPHQWKLRSQALSIIGIGRDKDGATDVAENHDDYLMDAFQNG